jgi:hypothetical protein
MEQGTRNRLHWHVESMPRVVAIGTRAASCRMVWSTTQHEWERDRYNAVGVARKPHSGGPALR